MNRVTGVPQRGHDTTEHQRLTRLRLVGDDLRAPIAEEPDSSIESIMKLNEDLEGLRVRKQFWLDGGLRLVTS